MPAVEWKNEPDDHDYPAAASYLTLLLPPKDVSTFLARIADAPISSQKAKDILRAARLPLLPPDNVHVQSDLAKIKKGDALSPILILRGDFSSDVALQIADGYHRVCASYHVDEDTDIPCRITDLG
ncbi:MAG TPA: hypothetical protein VIJ76_01360 [Galbitalea sp.]